MTEPQTQRRRYALCQVEIDSNGTIKCISAKVGLGCSKLWARFCQYLSTDEQKGLCINQDASKRGEEQPGDASLIWLRSA